MPDPTHAVPPTARAAMDVALRALEAAPGGWLGMPERRRLRAQYGPWTPWREPGSPDAGLLRRAALSIACVERALPVWEAAVPGDRRPHEIVALTRRVLWDGAPEEPLDALAEALDETVERMGGAVGEEDDPWPFYAGLAAVRLTIEAFEGDLDPELHPPEESESDLDEPRVEALAARALCGWDADALRRFWRWYVAEAFPGAYRAAP